MADNVAQIKRRQWRKDQYLISTDSSLLNVKDVNAALDSDDIYWATGIPDQAARAMLDNSLCFGLFDTTDASDLRFMGMARCMTDFVTFVYLTDVYVKPGHQGAGLGRWLISCVREVMETMPYLRRTMLVTSDWERSVPFYEQTLGMSVLQGRNPKDNEGGHGVALMMSKGRGHPDNLKPGF